MPRGRPRKITDDVLMKSAELIGWALGGIEREISTTRDRLASLTAQADTLRARLPRGASKGTASQGGGATAGAPGMGRKRRRRRMSPEARKRMSEMMKKRWAERRRKQ